VKEFSTKQFIVSEIVLTLSTGLLLCPGGLALSLATMLICASGFIMMTRAERFRPLGSRDIVWIVATLLAFAVLVTAAKHFLSDDTVASSILFLRHPAFLLPIWIFITWRGYRKWRHAKPTTNAKVQGMQHPSPSPRKFPMWFLYFYCNGFIICRTVAIFYSNSDRLDRDYVIRHIQSTIVTLIIMNALIFCFRNRLKKQ
jgi:hypothetical protein